MTVRSDSSSGHWKAYPEYKDSGVEWLGEIPVHWESVLLRWISQRYSGGTPDKRKLEYWDDGTIPWINSGAVNQGLIVKPSTYITEEAFKSSSAKWIPKGALVMALAGQGKTKGMVAQLGIETTCNQSMAAIVPDERTNSRFIFWWLSSNYDKIRNLAGGEIRDGLNLEMLSSIRCPLLSLPEQKTIATFLDERTARIDAIVEKKERQIELLKEKRSALISHVVTKGLDPDAEMKESGVEWLGEIPAGWGKNRVSRIGNIKGRIGWRGYTASDLRDKEDGVLVIGATHISKNGEIDLKKATYLSYEKYEESPEIKLFGEEILIVKVGATIGKIGYFPPNLGKATINPNVMLLKKVYPLELNSF